MFTLSQPSTSTYVLNDDVIPRVSYGSLRDLRTLIMQQLAQCESGYLALMKTLAERNAFFRRPWQRDENHTPPVVPLSGTDRSERLYLAGKIYHIVSAEEGPRIFRSKSRHFEDIVLSSRMMLDHMPGAYENALLLAKGVVKHKSRLHMLWYRLRGTLRRVWIIATAPYIRWMTACLLVFVTRLLYQRYSLRGFIIGVLQWAKTTLLPQLVPIIRMLAPVKFM